MLQPQLGGDLTNAPGCINDTDAPPTELVNAVKLTALLIIQVCSMITDV